MRGDFLLVVMPVETLPFSPGIIEESEEETRQAYLPLYKIIMWDDNVTTMEFVIRVLIKLFSKDYSAAEKLMYEFIFMAPPLS